MTHFATTRVSATAADGTRQTLDELVAAATAAGEVAPADLCLKVASAAARAGETALAVSWLRRLADAPPTFRAWAAGAGVLAKLDTEAVAAALPRSARVAVAGSYNTAQLVPMLALAGLRAGIRLELHEGGYDQYQQDLLAPGSALHRFGPQYVVLAVHDGALDLPAYTEDPEGVLAAEVERWQGLWTAAERAGGRVVQATFAVPPHDEFGHLGARLPGSKQSLIRALNAALGEAAGSERLLVDCERLAGAFGKERWFDARYWHLSKQAVALDALPGLALATAAVLAGDLGLGKKCIAVDLDNTLWGGVVGEDGLAGIQLGHGPAGEAFVAFQEALLALKRRGLLLAVCSKNNDADAREAFERHPDMRLRLDDVACFDASWSTKAESLRRIAATLGIGVDSLVFVDDNPAERELVRQLAPEVDVLALPDDPASYAGALLAYPFFETTSFGAEDARRTELYRARQEAAAGLGAAGDVETFLRGLEMRAEIAPVDELHFPRVTQLIGKTNQFNLTTRRHDAAAVRAFMDAGDAVCLFLKLRDRLADHGLVGVAIAVKEGDTLDVDTLLLSCRVIGRTVERSLLGALAGVAGDLGCSVLRGTYVPSGRNEVVRTMYEEQGFTLAGERDGTTTWVYDLAAQGPLDNPLVEATVLP